MLHVAGRLEAAGKVVPLEFDASDTLNLDEPLVEAAITTRIRALAQIDYAGGGCEMESFSALARAHGLVVIEDAVQGYGASHRGRPFGTLADLACLSFHETASRVSAGTQADGRDASARRR